MGEAGCVGWMFEKKGQITIKKELTTEDNLMEIVLNAGGEDVIDAGDFWQVVTKPGDLYTVNDALQKAGIEIEESTVARVPQSTIKVEGKVASQVLKLIEALEDSDDVQHVYANFEADPESIPQE